MKRIIYFLAVATLIGGDALGKPPTKKAETVWYIYHMATRRCYDARRAGSYNMSPDSMVALFPKCKKGEAAANGFLSVDCTKEPKVGAILMYGNTLKACQAISGRLFGSN